MAINQRGSTLIELIAVIGIILIISAIVSFNIGGWLGSSDVQVAAEELAGEIRLMQQLAITQDTTWEMRFGEDSEGSGYYYLRYLDDEGFVIDHHIYLPEMVYWGDVNDNYSPVDEVLTFKYNGVPNAGLVIGLHSERGHQYYVVVAAVTGKVRVATIYP